MELVNNSSHIIDITVQSSLSSMTPLPTDAQFSYIKCSAFIAYTHPALHFKSFLDYNT